MLFEGLQILIFVLKNSYLRFGIMEAPLREKIFGGWPRILIVRLLKAYLNPQY